MIKSLQKVSLHTQLLSDMHKKNREITVHQLYELLNDFHMSCMFLMKLIFRFKLNFNDLVSSCCYSCSKSFLFVFMICVDEYALVAFESIGILAP